MLEKIKKKAFAKINLSLEITGKLENGYHTLSTLMHKISLCDEISVCFNNQNRISVKCSVPVCDEKDNIAYKAAQAMLSLFNRQNNTSLGTDIEITKNIPFGAGLGGGSADCAAVMDIINNQTRFFKKEHLHEIANQLGADVPFCLEGHKFSLATGTGNNLYEINKIAHDFSILVIKPKVFCGTKEMYNLFDENFPFSDGQKTEKAACNGKSFPENFSLCSNDFEKVAEILYPDIKDIINTAKTLSPYYAGLSGSGSAVFAVFESIDKAERCKEKLLLNHNPMIENTFIEKFV